MSSKVLLLFTSSVDLGQGCLRRLSGQLRRKRVPRLGNVAVGNGIQPAGYSTMDVAVKSGVLHNGHARDFIPRAGPPGLGTVNCPSQTQICYEAFGIGFKLIPKSKKKYLSLLWNLA